MQNEIKIFEFEHEDIEVIFLNEEPLFDPYSIGKYLLIQEPAVRMALGKMDEDEKMYLTQSELANVNLNCIRKIPNRGLTFLRESGLYALIIQSRKPEAEKFRKWVTKEVLPQIRKTGSYELTEQHAKLQRLSDNLDMMVQSSYGIIPSELVVLGDENWNKRLYNLLIDCTRQGMGRMNNLYNMLFDEYYEETGVDVPALAEGRNVERKYYIKSHPVLAESLFKFAQRYFDKSRETYRLIPLDQSRLDTFAKKGL